VLGVLAAAALTYSLMQSLVIPALPAIQRALGASADQTSWTVTGFLLSSAVATPIAGRLGDLYGKRRVLVGVLAIVTAGALEVYAASALLGIGTGIAMAALATLIVSHVARGETGAAAGVNNVARTLGGAVGAQLAAALLAAGGLHDARGYTLAFAVGLVGSLAATLLGPPASRTAGGAHSDSRRAAPRCAGAGLSSLTWNGRRSRRTSSGCWMTSTRSLSAS